jgi:hypothetical protein
MRNHQRRAKVTSEMVAEVLELNESAVRLGKCRFLSQLRGEVPRNVGGSRSYQPCLGASKCIILGQLEECLCDVNSVD